MGKLNSNLLLFALAFGEEGQAGGAGRRGSPPAAGSCRTGGQLRGQVLALLGGPLRPQSQETVAGSNAFPSPVEKHPSSVRAHLNTSQVVCSAEGAEEQSKFGTNCDQKMGKLCRNRKSSVFPNPRPTAPHCSRSPRAKTLGKLRPTPRRWGVQGIIWV